MNPPSKKQREKTKRKNKEKKHLPNFLITWKKFIYAVIFENSPNYFQNIL
jgi:hypothetical protein